MGWVIRWHINLERNLAVHYLAHLLTMGFDLQMGPFVHLPYVVVVAKLSDRFLILFEFGTPHFKPFLFFFIIVTGFVLFVVPLPEFAFPGCECILS